MQWGWSHRNENEFYFDDIDRLMDLAYENNLQVTLNVIFDVAPVWIFNKYPEAKIVLANGRVVEPHAVGHRQIGGFPGTCYNHHSSFVERMKFLKETVERYKNHPALHMWDIRFTRLRQIRLTARFISVLPILLSDRLPLPTRLQVQKLLNLIRYLLIPTR